MGLSPLVRGTFTKPPLWKSISEQAAVGTPLAHLPNANLGAIVVSDRHRVQQAGQGRGRPRVPHHRVGSGCRRRLQRAQRPGRRAPGAPGRPALSPTFRRAASSGPGEGRMGDLRGRGDSWISGSMDHSGASVQRPTKPVRQTGPPKWSAKHRSSRCCKLRDPS